MADVAYAFGLSESGARIGSTMSLAGLTLTKIARVTLTGAQTDQTILAGIDVSEVRAFAIEASGAVLVETNHATIPKHSWNITGAGGFAWVLGNGLPSPFSLDATDVTAFFFTGTDVTVDIWVAEVGG